MPLEPDMVRLLVVHCSASPPSAKVNAAVIDRWHRERGFRKIGYHYVVNRDGSVEVGRKLYEIGAHALGFNEVSLGICLVGGVNKKGEPEDNFTATQMAKLRMVLTGLLKLFPEADILGHRDLPGVTKACPSFNVRSWWAGP